MQISGVQKFTLLDFPSKTSCIVFTPFCNFRCPYCYNSDFVIPEKIEKIKDIFIPENIFFNFLKTRVGFLDGVVISGGEPTMQNDLIDFIKKIKELGFLVKLDTNGTNPEFVKKIYELDLLDYIAMDIKAPLQKYSETVGCDVDILKIKESVDFIKTNVVDYEFRTTVVKEQLSVDDLMNIGEFLSGVKKYYLQKFNNTHEMLNPEFINKTTYTSEEFFNICKTIQEKFNIKICNFR